MTGGNAGSTPLILTDDDVAGLLTADRAVALAREALLLEHAGGITSPPRARVELGGGELVLTAGSSADWYGYREYATYARATEDQLVIVHDRATGKLRALAIGTQLGTRRTGGINGAAADALSAPEASSIAIIGAGPLAWAQLWAIAAVRRLDDVRVFARTASSRERFAERARAELGLPAVASETAEDAVRGAAIVITATKSSVPVIDANWLAEGAYLSCLGRKHPGNTEIPPAVLERSARIVTDSLVQLRSYSEPDLTAGTTHASRVESLGAVLASAERTGPSAPATQGDVTLFLSVGLAGSEVHILHALAAQQPI